MSTNSTGSANPLSSGSSPNSVESAAAGMDRLFGNVTPQYVGDDPEDEEQPSPKQQRQAKTPRAEAVNEGNGTPAAKSKDEEEDEDDISAGDLTLEGHDADEEDPEDADDDEADEEEGDEDGDEDGDDDPEQDMHEVTVSGKKVSVTLDELKKGYSRSADYHQKTTQLSKDRKQVIDFAVGLQPERDALIQHAEEFKKWAEALKPKPEDWATLKRDNPQLYITMQEQWAELEQKVAVADRATQTVKGRGEQVAGLSEADWKASEQEKLLAKVPALQDPNKASKFAETIYSNAERLGYTEEELRENAVDHRDILALYYAARYLEILDRKNGAKTKTKQRGPRRAGASTNVRSTVTRRNVSDDLRGAAKEHRKRGTQQSAAMAFTAMIQDR